MEKLPVPQLRTGQVLLRLLAAPVNPSDLGTIGGSYGELPPLPAVAGREGVGEVIASAAEELGLRPRDRVLLPESGGTWQQFKIAHADELIRVPSEVPVEQAAMAGINPPTALLLLDSFVQLRKGDWVIQNAANSAVGHLVIQLCHQRGLRTVNVVRSPEWIEPLKAIGGDTVLVEGAELPEQVRKAVADRPPRLALNSVGGNSAAHLIKCLAPAGTLVTFGGMTGEPVRFPTRYLIFNDVRLVGFWLHRWKASHSAGEVRDLLADVFRLMGDGVLQAPVEKAYTLTDYRAAVEHAGRPGRRGKVLLTGAA